MPAGAHRSGLAAFGLTAILTFVLCQISSYVVDRRLPLEEPIVVSPVLYLTHLRNTGGVFGMFQGNVVVFASVSLAVVAIAIWYMLREAQWARYQYVCFGLIVGAAGSNVFDRILYGAVIDFIDVQGIPGWHYVFNVADIAIHLGAWPLALGAVLVPRRAGVR